MGALEIGMEELLPQKRDHKNNFVRTGTSEKNLLQWYNYKNHGKN